MEFRKKVFSSYITAKYRDMGVSAGVFGFTAQPLCLGHKAANYGSSAQHIVAAQTRTKLGSYK